MGKAAKVICRCRKVCTSFAEWKKHLAAKHPKWMAELEGAGELEQDKEIFKAARKDEGRG